MPHISSYNWPNGSIVKPLSDTTGWMYRVGAEYRIEPHADSQVVRLVGQSGALDTLNGHACEWELVSLPTLRDYGFPEGSRVRVVSYPVGTRFGHVGQLYGPVGSTGRVFDGRVLMDADGFEGAHYIGDHAVWELVSSDEQSKLEVIMELEAGKLYEVSGRMGSFHCYNIGDVVECLNVMSPTGRGHFQRLTDGKTQYMWAGEYKPFEGEYKPKYYYIKPNLKYYSREVYSQEWYPVIDRDTGSLLILDDSGGRRWLHQKEEYDTCELLVTEEPLPLDSVLADWGSDLNTLRRFSQAYDYNNIFEFLRDNMPKPEEGAGYSWFSRAVHFKPMQSRKVRGQIAVYQSKEKLDRDLQTAMKPGRAFRLMFPELTDAQIEVLVDRFRARFPVLDYKLHISDEAEAFKLAYSGTQEPMQNPYTTSARKSLANSCMRYDFDHLPNHPAEAYASGEFKIFYTTGVNNRIGSRCVVWYGHSSGRPVAGPIYGVCEHSIDTIANALEKENAFMYGEEDWRGAKLRKIKYRGEGVIAPYIDGHFQWLRDQGDWLTIDSRGDYDASNYNGVLGGSDYTCESCGEGVHEDDVHWDEAGDYAYCESCFRDNHTRCDHYDEYYPNDEMTTVYTMRRGRRYGLTVCQRAIDNGYYVYCESDGEYWNEDDVTVGADGECIDPISRDTYYFECAWCNEWFPSSEMCELTDGTQVAREQIEADEGYFLNSDGKYEKKEAA